MVGTQTCALATSSFSTPGFVADAFGYVLAEDVKSPENVPAFPASIKDGYAVIGMALLHWLGENLEIF